MAAERSYKAILSAQPDQFDALHYLGVLERQRGNHDDAYHLIRRALEIDPRSAEAHANLGNVLQAANRHEQALACYDRALALRPKYAGALNNRGNALQTLNRHAEALASYDKALAIQPRLANALNNRGVALAALRRPGEAIANYDAALAINPDYADAVANRGAALEALGRLHEALQSYQRTLALKPDHVVALNNRGNVLRALQRHEQALASYDTALTIAPSYLDALVNRGNALLALGRPEQALASYEKALALKPDDAGALNGQGNARGALSRHEEALASYDAALTIAPSHLDALVNRGNALLALNRLREAIASYDRALAVKPGLAQGATRGHADVLVYRGVALEALDRLEAAVASYDKALALEPGHANALNKRGNTLLALRRHGEAQRTFENLLALEPDYPYARGALLHIKMQCCEWRDYASDVPCLNDAVRAGKPATEPFDFLGVSESAQDQLVCARTYAQANYPALASLSNGQSYAHDRIHLAYLSGDFHDHATAFLMAELFERHDSTRFETSAVSFGPNLQGVMRTRLERAFERFIDARWMSDHDIARLLRELEIDIAVDLKGFTKGARLRILASRPAPIQVSYLGYPGTLGVDYIDYILADRCVIPEDQHACYAEKVVYLPDSYQVNDSKRRIAELTPTRAEVGLPENAFVFCSFNAGYKITPEVFDVWMRLLQAVHGSLLWLVQSNTAASRNLRREATLRGVAPHRLVFAPHTRLQEHLARHRLADLFLDTLPCNAHTTASDALWAGLPLVTCLGATFAGRVAGSLLRAAGLPELITHSLADYEALARKLAMEPTMLAELRRKLARNHMPLFDTDRSRRHIEAAYEGMWHRHQRGELPQSFTVEPIAQRCG